MSKPTCRKCGKMCANSFPIVKRNLRIEFGVDRFVSESTFRCATPSCSRDCPCEEERDTCAPDDRRVDLASVRSPNPTRKPLPPSVEWLQTASYANTSTIPTRKTEPRTNETNSAIPIPTTNVAPERLVRLKDPPERTLPRRIPPQESVFPPSRLGPRLKTTPSSPRLRSPNHLSLSSLPAPRAPVGPSTLSSSATTSSKPCVDAPTPTHPSVLRDAGRVESSKRARVIYLYHCHWMASQTIPPACKNKTKWKAPGCDVARTERTEFEFSKKQRVSSELMNHDSSF